MCLKLILTSLPKVIWEEGRVAAKVSHGPVWQRGRKWPPDDGEFTMPHQLVPPLWAKQAHVKNIQLNLWVCGCVRMTQVCLIRVTFDPLCCQAGHFAKPNYFQTSRHTYRRQSRFRNLDSYRYWGIQWFCSPNLGMSRCCVQVGQGCGGCCCHYYSQDHDFLTV